jgi:hypothetical protein
MAIAIPTAAVISAMAISQPVYDAISQLERQHGPDRA